MSYRHADAAHEEDHGEDGGPGAHAAVVQSGVAEGVDVRDGGHRVAHVQEVPVDAGAVTGG